MRYAKHKHRQAAEQEKVQHPQRDVWQLFTKQKFATGGGGHVKVDNRPKLFFPHHAKGA